MFLRTKNVAVILSEPTNAQQPVQRARPFVAIDGSQLEQPQRQLAIATLAITINEAVHRAVHRLGVIGAVVHFHRRIHAVFVEVEMPGSLEQVRVGQVRRVDKLVAAVLVTLAAVVLHDFAHGGTFGVPHGETATQFRGKRQQIHLDGEATVVALFGFFQTHQVFLQGRLRFPRGAVDALQGWPFFVAAPVCTSHFHQRKMGESTSAWHVRPATQVDERVAVAIHAD